MEAIFHMNSLCYRCIQLLNCKSTENFEIVQNISCRYCTVKQLGFTKLFIKYTNIIVPFFVCYKEIFILIFYSVRDIVLQCLLVTVKYFFQIVHLSNIFNNYDSNDTCRLFKFSLLFFSLSLCQYFTLF